ESHVQVLDLGGPIADETGLHAAASRPSQPGAVNADTGIDEIARGIEPIDRAGGHDLAHRQTPRDVSDGLWRDGRSETAAQGSEPLQPLAVLEIHQLRGVADDADQRRVAYRAGTDRGQIGALVRVLQVRFDAREPIAGNPVVAGLGAEDAAL